MDTNMLDWDELRTFLAIAQGHTLSAAARRLGVQQSTISRRLDALEARAGVRLLQKTPNGYLLTAAGEAALGHVERMELEALAMERAVTGLDERLEGTVRLATVGALAASVLPSVLTGFHARYPRIAVEVVTDGRSVSLSRREADLSLWPERPDGNELVVRKVADVPFGVFASPDYLARTGMPDFDGGAAGHNIILRPEENMGQAEMVWMSRIAHGAPPVRGLWLVVHEDTRHTPRIRALMDAIASGLSRAFR
jgi:DNA-binding transcriptional LysR family regulator